MSAIKTQRFPIGTKFQTRGKHSRTAEVVDVLTTYNSAGEVHKVTYVSEHEFFGQKVRDYDVPEATIARGFIE